MEILPLVLILISLPLSSSCEVNCQDCSTSSQCIACVERFYLSANNNCRPCEHKKCVYCIHRGSYCINCESGYRAKSGRCLKEEEDQGVSELGLLIIAVAIFGFSLITIHCLYKMAPNTKNQNSTNILKNKGIGSVDRVSSLDAGNSLTSLTLKNIEKTGETKTQNLKNSEFSTSSKKRKARQEEATADRRAPTRSVSIHRQSHASNLDSREENLEVFTFGVPSVKNSDEGTLEDPTKNLIGPLLSLKIPPKRMSSKWNNPPVRNTLRRVSLQGLQGDRKTIEKSIFNRQQQELLRQKDRV